MKNLIKLTLILVSTFLYLSSTYAAVPNNSDPTTFLGPTLQGGYTKSLSNNTAWNIAGEAGVKNYRVGTTLGHALSDNQRIKVSAEYLTQNITYAFFSGNTNQWVGQGAVGADYQYDLSYKYYPQLDMQAYYSHAPSKSLDTVTGSYTNAGTTTDYINYRRIAGSNAGGISPGITIQPLAGTKTGIALNYDVVHYDNINTPAENVNGIGATARIDQAITQNATLGLEASVRQPFNNYQANLAFANVPFMGNWTVALEGAYTVGHENLPDSYNVGLSFNYLMDEPVHSRSAVKAISHENDVAAWTAKPAVHMPEVLAVVDEKTLIAKAGCSEAPPILNEDIPDQIGIAPTPIVFDSSTFFIGNNLTYTVTSTTITGSVNVSIDSTTGVLTMTSAVGGSTATATVTATDSCGASVSSNTFGISFF